MADSTACAFTSGQVYALAQQLFPDMLDIAYDCQMGHVIRFPNRWGNPMPQVWIGGSQGDLVYLWHWLCDQVTFRIECELKMAVKLLAAY